MEQVRQFGDAEGSCGGGDVVESEEVGHADTSTSGGLGVYCGRKSEKVPDLLPDVMAYVRRAGVGVHPSILGPR